VNGEAIQAVSEGAGEFTSNYAQNNNIFLGDRSLTNQTKYISVKQHMRF